MSAVVALLSTTHQHQPWLPCSALPINISRGCLAQHYPSTSAVVALLNTTHQHQPWLPCSALPINISRGCLAQHYPSTSAVVALLNTTHQHQPWLPCSALPINISRGCLAQHYPSTSVTSNRSTFFTHYQSLMHIKEEETKKVTMLSAEQPVWILFLVY